MRIRQVLVVVLTRDLILRSAASSRRVSKDGSKLGRARGHPSSFESLRTAAHEGGLLRMRAFNFFTCSFAGDDTQTETTISERVLNTNQ